MWDSGGIAQRTVTLETDGGERPTSSPIRFTTWKEHKQKFHRKLSGPQGRCVRFGGEQLSTPSRKSKTVLRSSSLWSNQYIYYAIMTPISQVLHINEKTVWQIN